MAGVLMAMVHQAVSELRVNHNNGSMREERASDRVWSRVPHAALIND